MRQEYLDQDYHSLKTSLTLETAVMRMLMTAARIFIKVETLLRTCMRMFGKVMTFLKMCLSGTKIMTRVTVTATT